MIAWILDMFGAWYDETDRKRREAYLAKSKDHSDVERRIRALERSERL